MNETFKTKKSLGQNFLSDKNIINKIIQKANVTKLDNVLEIGPGLGSLTEILVEKANRVQVIELDDRLIPILEEKYQNYTNFKILHMDFLRTTLEDLTFILDDQKKLKVVANLPYYITTPIIIKILLEYKNIDEIYIMIQKEVAERFTSSYKKKKYGSITVFLQTISDVKYEFTVPKTVFKPRPKIDSAIVSFQRKKLDSDQFDFVDFEKFLKACFMQKRKTLINNLAKSYNIDKEKILSVLKDNGYHNLTRAEEITPVEYSRLYKNWKEFEVHE